MSKEEFNDALPATLSANSSGEDVVSDGGVAEHHRLDYPLVAIGASAGGLEYRNPSASSDRDWAVVCSSSPPSSVW
jgi:hypothetical protein